jgi:hypothetical protein
MPGITRFENSQVEISSKARHASPTNCLSLCRSKMSWASLDFSLEISELLGDDGI